MKKERTKTVGEIIKALRIGAGLTQQGLADEIGVTVQTINRIEKDKSDPTTTDLDRIYAACGQEFRLPQPQY